MSDGRGSVPVVGDLVMLRLPSGGGALADDEARVRRAVLDVVGARVFRGVGLEPDASGVDHQLPGREADRPRVVRVPGDHERMAGDHLVGSERQRRAELLAEIDQVGLRGAVADENVGGELERGRQPGEPGALGVGGVLERVLVARSAGLGGAGEELALVVAADDRSVEAHEHVGSLGGLERAGEEVSGDDQAVDVPEPANPGEDGLQGPDVPVNVGDDGQPHGGGA